LTGHTNKNLIIYRFDPHGSKGIENLVVHNIVGKIFVNLSNNVKKDSLHYKLVFCYDQEPLNFNLYSSTYFDDERTKQFQKWEGPINRFITPVGKAFIRRQNIAGHPCVTPSIYNKSILIHSEKNSEDLKKYEKNGFIGCYYWSHAFIALDWYRFAKHDKSLDLIPKIQFDRDFNIYARSWTGTREYRLKFLELLEKNSIDEVSTISFNEYCDGNHYAEYKTKNKKWQFEKGNINCLNNIKLEDTESSASATYDVGDYKNSAIDIVLETVFDQNKIQLTEKILRPIACGKPFILISEKGSLEYLKSYGFKTFNDLIDESYDNVECPTKRLEKIIQTMKTISSLSQTKKNHLFFEMHKIAEFNKKWFFSDEFFNKINDELKKNLKYGLDMLDNPEYQTAKSPRLYYRAYRKYKKYLSEDAKMLADIAIDQYPERIELSKKNIGKY